MREYDPNVYGYVNGSPVYSRDEFVFTVRKFGAIENDEDLVRFASKVTHGWSDAGWKRSLETFYLGSYCLDEPCRSLTDKEYERLKYLQQKAIEAKEEWDESLNWRFVERIYWADNSVEELWINGLGETKTVMATAPHGDACF